MPRRIYKAPVFAVVLIAAVCPGIAQVPLVPAPRPSAPGVSVEPENTTTTFGDWTLRCQRVSDGAQAKRACEVTQTIQVQGQQLPFAQIALGSPAAGQPMHVIAAVPVNVSFPSNVNIATDDNDPGIELAWTRCLQGGCFAESQIKDDVLRRWRTFAEPGRLTLKDASGREIRVAISYRGLAQSLDALAKANAAAR